MAPKRKNKGLSPKTQKTFETIIKHARKQFAHYGYSNASIQMIASKAKVSVGFIYKYFKNKDDLYKYIIDNEQIKIRAYLDSHISTCKNRKEKEKEGLRAWLKYVKDNPGVYKLIWETLFINKEAFNNYYNTFANSYRKALEKDVDELINTNFQNIAFMLIGISNFLGIKLITSDKEIDDTEIDEIVDTAIEILSRGLFK